MLDNNLIQSTSSWPFVEIRKLLKDRKDLIKAKNKITFQTGYGPSGLPHIGTFGEVARTTMMINALNHIKKIDHELITFSDDMDGLRKIPDNIPNDKILKDNLGKPLTAIPDPFKKYNSLKYIDVLKKGLKVMDATAVSLCMDNKLPLVVFNLTKYGNIEKVVMGEKIGTKVSK